jgi:hypothetical protein
MKRKRPEYEQVQRFTRLREALDAARRGNARPYRKGKGNYAR